MEISNMDAYDHLNSWNYVSPPKQEYRQKGIPTNFERDLYIYIYILEEDTYN